MRALCETLLIICGRIDRLVASALHASRHHAILHAVSPYATGPSHLEKCHAVHKYGGRCLWALGHVRDGHVAGTGRPPYAADAGFTDPTACARIGCSRMENLGLYHGQRLVASQEASQGAPAARRSDRLLRISRGASVRRDGCGNPRHGTGSSSGSKMLSSARSRTPRKLQRRQDWARCWSSKASGRCTQACN